MAFLEVNKLSKYFDSLEVLKNISFQMDKGDVVAIIGSSGSGKTTLLRCLNFLERADTGTIKVNNKLLYDGVKDKDSKLKDIREKRRHFGLVFQSFNLFPHYNVVSNVALADILLNKEKIKQYKQSKKQEIKDAPDKYQKRDLKRALKSKVSAYAKDLTEQEQSKAMNLLTQVGLADKAKSYPHELSGGQQQRVAIARALALNPDILCFDEPTSALDPELTGEVLRVIRGLKSYDRTMIVVTHEMNFAKNVADKIIFMADGVVEEIGSPEEIFSRPKSPKLQAFLEKSLENIG